MNIELDGEGTEMALASSSCQPCLAKTFDNGVENEVILLADRRKAQAADWADRLSVA